MSQLIYEITLFYDGKYSICVKSDDLLSLKDALPLAKKVQQELAQGSETQAAAPSVPQQAPLPSVESQSQAPLCGIHATLMTQVQGKRGLFWSCHQRNLDGSWCTYRPARAGSSSSAYSFSPA